MEKELEQFYGHPLYLKVLEDLTILHNAKNKQYADPGRPLGNFERGAAEMKDGYNDAIRSDKYRSMIFYAMNLANKQWDGTRQIVFKNKTGTPDSLEEKLRDMANYMIFCIIFERLRLEELKKDKVCEKYNPELPIREQMENFGFNVDETVTKIKNSHNDDLAITGHS